MIALWSSSQAIARLAVCVTAIEIYVPQAAIVTQRPGTKVQFHVICQVKLCPRCMAL